MSSNRPVPRYRRLRRGSGPSSSPGAVPRRLGAHGLLTFEVTGVRQLDAKAVNAFWPLQNPSTVNTLRAITNSANAVPFAIAIAVLVGLAVHTRQARLIPLHRDPPGWSEREHRGAEGGAPGHDPIVFGIRLQTVPSFPSGHATVAMSIALSAVLLTPCRGRTFMAWLATVYALAVGYSVLVLTSHFPSDVIAGYLMAGAWAALAIGARSAFEQRTSSAGRIERRVPPRTKLAPVVAMLPLCLAAAGIIGVATASETSRALLVVSAGLVGASAIAVVAAVARCSTTHPGLQVAEKRLSGAAGCPVLIAPLGRDGARAVDEARNG